MIRSPASVDQGLVADRGPDPQPRLVQAALERGLADADDLCGLLGGLRELFSSERFALLIAIR